jgi:hypothetical protein
MVLLIFFGTSFSESVSLMRSINIIQWYFQDQYGWRFLPTSEPTTSEAIATR